MNSAIGVASEECWGRAEGSGDGPEPHLLQGKRTTATAAARKRRSVRARVHSQWRSAGAAAAAAAAHLATAATRRVAIDRRDGHGCGNEPRQ